MPHKQGLTSRMQVRDRRLAELPKVTSSELTEAPLLMIDTAGCNLYEAPAEHGESRYNEARGRPPCSATTYVCACVRQHVCAPEPHRARRRWRPCTCVTSSRLGYHRPRWRSSRRTTPKSVGVTQKPSSTHTHTDTQGDRPSKFKRYSSSTIRTSKLDQVRRRMVVEKCCQGHLLTFYFGSGRIPRA
jgi:hypothetical protein